jgi:hypothetical protein
MTAATPSPAGEPDGLRQFTDAAGRHWTVAEERIPHTDWTQADDDGHHAGYAVGWLHFTCAETQKRLRLFPRHWRTLSDAELDRLCRRALGFHSGE